MDDLEKQRYDEAKERVKAIKGFYIHLIVYICVIAFLAILNLITSPDQIWFYWPLLGWGVGIVAHGLGVFGFGGVFGKDWEQKKIRQIMEKEGDKKVTSDE